MYVYIYILKKYSTHLFSPLFWTLKVVFSVAGFAFQVYQAVSQITKYIIIYN